MMNGFMMTLSKVKKNRSQNKKNGAVSDLYATYKSNFNNHAHPPNPAHFHAPPRTGAGRSGALPLLRWR